ncbi:MAG TPA: hypothetical protein VGI39_29725 [Polyangiaceae bacterium]|jgi:hypothetical protein
MARDSLFGERIVWSGRPKVATVPFANKVAAGFGAVVSVVALCFAVVVARGLDAPVGGMLFFAGWCATLSLGAWRFPLVWRTRLEYQVTDKHVIWRRGPLRRSIERNAISYATVRWNPSVPGVGDLVLVRAVPTGALRRTLRVTLGDVEAPDRLWAIVRGLEPAAPLGNGERPLGQRLDEGERVLWTAMPVASPWSWRRISTAALGLVLAWAPVWMLLHAVPSLRRVLRVNALSAGMMGMLIAGVALGAALLLAVALYIGYVAWIRPVRQARTTRYWVTDKRVLIRRAHEELHLDRGRIAYVIDAPAAISFTKRLRDLYLVLDGPKARALAMSGAFGGFGRDDELSPVLGAIDDVEAVGAILQGSPPQLEPLPHAA